MSTARACRARVLLGATLIAGVGLTIATASTAAQPAPSSKRPADVDVRLDYPLDQAPSIWQRLQLRTIPGATARFDPQQGTVSRLLRYGGYLTGPSNAVPVRIARDFLRTNAALFGLDDADVAGLVVSRRYRTEKTGATHLAFQQTDGNRRVYGSSIGFTIARDGRILIAGGPYYPGATAASPSLEAAEAVVEAARAIGARSRGPLRPISVSGLEARFVNTFARGLERPSNVTAELVTFPSAPGQDARPAWSTVIEVDQFGWYESVVDARTGEILFRENGYVDSGPQGTVFTAAHPEVTGATRTVQPFTGTNGTWVTDRLSSGNNVNAYQDLTQTNTAEYQTQTPANGDPASQHFDYAFGNDWAVNGPYDMTPAGPTGYVDADAAITQLFYYTNRVHDFLYAFGFDEDDGNFQVNNFGNGGAGNDPVLAEASDGYEDGIVFNCGGPPPTRRCVNNANFNTPADGTSPRMQMFMWESPDRDGSFDGDLVAHEYGHGLSERLIGNGTVGTGLQAGAMGEGWGDVVNAFMWDDPVFSEYPSGNATSGLRIYDMSNSPADYSDLCDVGNSNVCEVHNDGEIWAATLWDMRVALVARYGAPTGENEAMQLMVDGLKNTLLSPSFLDARDGLLTADVNTNASANQCLIWGVFAGREMGFSAASAGSNDSDPDEATDGPATCTPTAVIAPNDGTVEGTNEPLSGTGSLDGDPEGNVGLTYEWDFDNDGDYDDATGATTGFDRVGQDGVYTVGLKVTNQYGFSDTASTTVAVANVAPTVTIGNDGPKAENTAVTVSGVVSDAGWLETPLTATINWGDGAGATALSGTVEEVRPFKTITYSEQHTYGDNGTFTVTVCAADDDTTNNCNTTQVTVTNVVPTAVIDLTGTTSINGVDTFVAHEGQVIPFTASSFDPGSDDRTTTWDWGDGAPSPDTSTLSLNDALFDPDPPNVAIPFPSPSINPRTVTDPEPHAFSAACFYTVTFGARDDDGDSASDQVAVIIAGNAAQQRGAGYWQTQYRPRPTSFSEERRQCYLAITRFMSTVFSEQRLLNSVAQAFDVLAVNQNSGSEAQKLDRELLAAWLNFANGAFDLGELVDTDGNGSPDTAFATVVATAEAVRIGPSTDAQKIAQRNILEQVNGS